MLGLHSKQKSDIIDDPDDSVYIPNDDENEIMQRIKEKDSSDDNYMVASSDERMDLRDGEFKMVDVGTIEPFNIVEDNIVLMNEVGNVLSNSSSWNTVQGVPYRTYKHGLYGVFNDLKTYKWIIDGFVLRLGGIFGVMHVDNIHHFVTFLSSQKYKKTGKYQQLFQLYHRDFQPSELATANNNWYITFIPMTEYGMQIKELHNKKEALFDIPYKKVP